MNQPIQQLRDMDRGEMEWAIYLEFLHYMCGEAPVQTIDILGAYRNLDEPSNTRKLLATTPFCIHSVLSKSDTKLLEALNTYLAANANIITPSELVLWPIQERHTEELPGWGQPTSYWLVYRMGTQIILGGDTVVGRIYG